MCCLNRGTYFQVEALGNLATYFTPFFFLSLVEAAHGQIRVATC